ncbi:MAG: ribonuclease PH [Candidatus Eisenbacteria bacterium]
MRKDGRLPEDPRPIEIRPGFLRHAEGSASIRAGHTWVICAATVEDRTPPFLKGTSRGWVTAEYGMLPRSVGTRMARGKPSGRSMEIQRLIGRCLRSVVDLDRLPQHTITIDCDVIEADGSTRAAAITGAFVALCEACRWMIADGRILKVPVRNDLAAVSVGLVRGQSYCDLTYEEDSAATIDMNVVMTSAGEMVGLHAGVEGAPIGPEVVQGLLGLAKGALPALFSAQRKALGMPLHGPFDSAFLKPRMS